MSPEPIRVRIEAMAHGGAGVGRVGGKVVFCEDTVPGDVVVAVPSRVKARYSLARLGEVLHPGPGRIAPPCPVFGVCGGCDWQMMSASAQRSAKREIVASQLSHLGGIDSPPVTETRAISPPFGYRNRIDLRLVEGAAALYRRRSHAPVVIDECPLVTSAVAARIAALEPASDADRATVRASEATGEGVTLQRRRGAWEEGVFHEVVAGKRFRVSGRAFFQVNTAGAEALVALVEAALALDGSSILLDGYAGGGLFSATVGDAARRVISVESDRVALADLAVNAPEAEQVAGRFERVELPPVDAAVVDPPRAGLGEEGVATLAAAGASRVAYVSCDPAALGRDARILARAGFSLEVVTPVDLFPQTHHIEAVAAFSR